MNPGHRSRLSIFQCLWQAYYCSNTPTYDTVISVNQRKHLWLQYASFRESGQRRTMIFSDVTVTIAVSTSRASRTRTRIDCYKCAPVPQTSCSPGETALRRRGYAARCCCMAGPRDNQPPRAVALTLRFFSALGILCLRFSRASSFAALLRSCISRSARQSRIGYPEALAGATASAMRREDNRTYLLGLSVFVTVSPRSPLFESTFLPVRFAIG